MYGEKNISSLTKLINQLLPIPSFGVSGSGHFVMNDNPQDFYKILSKVIRQ